MRCSPPTSRAPVSASGTAPLIVADSSTSSSGPAVSQDASNTWLPIEGINPASDSTPLLDPFALTLSEQAVGYDDLDEDGDLTLGDRVHYRIDYGNPGLMDATGVSLRSNLDTAHVASVEAVSDSGGVVNDPDAEIPTAVQWDIGTVAAGMNGSVTYDVILRDDPVMVREGWAFPSRGRTPMAIASVTPGTRVDTILTLAPISCVPVAGTPLAAVVDGRFPRQREDTGLGGITLWLSGDDGNSYYYAHLSFLIQQGIDEGVRVVAGQGHRFCW